MGRKKAPAAPKGRRQDPYDYQDGYYLEDGPEDEEAQGPRRGLWWKLLLLGLLALAAGVAVWAMVSPDFAESLSRLKQQIGQLLRVVYQKLRAVF